MRRLVFGCCAAAICFAFFAASAGAVEVIESQEPNGVPETAEAGWQSGLCTEDPCSDETPELFFEQAAGHPPDAYTQVIAKHHEVEPIPGLPVSEPDGTMKTLLVDLPTGLSVNGQATPQCELELRGGEEAIPTGGCPPDTEVGKSEVTAFAFGFDLPFTNQLPVYNLKPRPGEPARFGFSLEELATVTLNAGVAWQSDYHEYFTIHIPEIPLAPETKLLSDRLFFDGATGQLGEGGAFLSNPSTCGDPAVEPFRHDYATILHADSHEEEAPEDDYDVAAPALPPQAFLDGSQEVTAFLPKAATPTGCENVPFEPTTRTVAGTTSTDSPAPATVEVKLPFQPHADIYQSNVKSVKLSLPQGLGINPAAAAGLSTCTEAQFGMGTRAPIECPADSRVGSVALETPVLPAGSLRGSAYLAPQASSDPESGKLYRLFLDATSAARGVSVRLLADVAVDKRTGHLTATIDSTPQLPFSSFGITFDATSAPLLTSPSTCGTYVTTGAFEAWSGSPDTGATEPGFNLTGAPGGGSCPKTGAERPFAPTLTAGPADPKANAASPYTLKVTRKDGEQELKAIDVTLPKGMTARLKGVSYCPAAAIAAAAQTTGKAQIAAPSCPQSSFIGTVAVGAGAGPKPLELSGDAYLAGPYKGAPLSLAIVTPAVAGPYDLGTVVVRAAVFVKPQTGQLRVVSDPIPDMLEGVRLDLRSLAVELSRPFFTRNGTSCKATSSRGSVAGGGNEPGNPAAFTTAKVSATAKATGCAKLGFKPSLSLRLSGATRRASHPHLLAVLRAHSKKDANVSALSVALPHALFLDQANLSAVCTRVQFAAEACPAKSIYGHAKVWSPLLRETLAGPVYLRSSSHKLPDLVAHLQGQIDIDLVGRIDSFQGGIRTSFEGVPDLPISKFKLDLPGGKGGLLIASRNLCQAPVMATVLATAHNGHKANLSRAVRAAGCGKKR